VAVAALFNPTQKFLTDNSESNAYPRKRAANGKKLEPDVNDDDQSRRHFQVAVNFYWARSVGKEAV
jgi:hypothetical protein